jgi:hypothetical protein
MLWILGELFNRRAVLKLKIFNNGNVKFDTAKRIILQDRKGQRPQLMTFQNGIYASKHILLISVNRGKFGNGTIFFSVYFGSSLSVVISLKLCRRCAGCTPTVSLIEEQ